MDKQNNKKMIISIVIVLLIIVIVVSSTYAIYRWRSTYGLNVSIQVTDDITITFDGGTNISGRLIPSIFPSGTIVKHMTIKSNLPSGNYSLYLKRNQLPSNIMNSSFKWLLSDCDYNNNSSCRSDMEIDGDFSSESISDYLDQTTGDLLLIDNAKVPFRYTQDLYLYLWIDGTVDNSPSMGGNHIDFDIYATGTSSNATLNEVSHD